MADLYYPSNLTTSGSNFITFTALKGGGGGPTGGSVSLYCPPGISFSDGAGFSTFDMGPLGNDIANQINEGISAESIRASIESGLNNATGPGGSDLKNLLAGKLIKEAGVIPGGGDLGTIYGVSKGIAVNPNTVTSFQNMNIRSFVFNFKLVPDDEYDSVTIKRIQDFFRVNMYAASQAGGYILSYPSKFTIRFLNGSGGDLAWMPKIYECYLTNFQSTHNSSSHLTHEDGAPTEVDISITFQETKVLTQQEIGELL